jgi:hypothetical protein
MTESMCGRTEKVLNVDLSDEEWAEVALATVASPDGPADPTP